MERRTQALTLPLARARAICIDGGAVGAWTLGFAVVAYLGLKGGGFDVVVRSQVGIAVWWIVGVAALCGLAGTRRLGWPLVTALGLMAAFTLWTFVSATWSLSSERAVSEAARDVTLLGVFVLAATGVRRRNARQLVHGMLGATVFACALALLSRFDPSGTSETGRFLQGSQFRLSYGLNYWNALGAFAAMGLPLALAVAVRARTVFGRAIAIAAVPVLTLTIFLTISRGATIAAVAGLLVALALTRHRMRWLLNAGLAGVASAILIQAAVQRDDVREGLTTALAHDQGSQLIVVVLIVVAGLGLLRAGLSLAAQAWTLPAALTRSAPSSRVQIAVFAGIVVAVLLVFVAAGGPGRVSSAWTEFKNPVIAQGNSDSSRLGSASGQGRYQYWVSATDAWESQPLQGIGAGGFENWWNQHATLPGHIRNAHSLYVETLAELGIVGAALLGALILLVLGAGVARSLAGPRKDRPIVAGATGALVVFFVSAAADWMWQVTVLPAAALLLAVVVLRSSRGSSRSSRAWTTGRRIGLGVLAVVGIAALVPALTAATELRASQQDALSSQFTDALERAGSAANVQPYAVSPPLQRALVLEDQGSLNAAAAQVRVAAAREPANWQPPFVLARIEAERGDTKAAVAAFRRAQSLNRTASFLHPQGFPK